MHRRLLFLLFLLPLVSLGSETYGPASIPPWVRRVDCPLAPLPLKPSQVHLQFLLNDTQFYWPKNAHYVHHAIKPLTIEGAALVAKVQIEFVPSWQRVQVHNICVFREGQWRDRLERARHALVQREMELDQDLYSGTCTLIYFLEDVRVGDIVAYTYTVEGVLPFFSTHLATGFSLQGSVIFEHFYRRLLASPGVDIDCKLFHTSHAPTVVHLSPEIREWSWELEETEPFIHDENSPVWYRPVASAQFSQYKSWGEVIGKLLPFFTLADGLTSALHPDMAALVQSWMEATAEPSERALMALRFVQDQVRYLGFEEGIDGIRPTDPLLVFQRRFGDCKDKVFLLHALLKCMQIPSTPVLVNTTRGKFLPESTPLPSAFNHIILRIEVDGEEFLVDATLSLQGGSSLSKTFCPIFYWGLPLSPSETSLLEIPGHFDAKPTQIDTSFVLTSHAMATLKIVRSFCGHKADAMRRFLSGVGTYNYTEDFCKTLQRSYGQASIGDDPVLSDDRKNNLLVLTQSYLLPTEKKGGRRVLKAFSLALLNYLESDLNPERKSPYALNYPMWVREQLHVETPYVDWEPDTDEYQCGNESIFYSSQSRREGGAFDTTFELMHLKDHVPPSAMREYWEITNEVGQDGFIYLHVADEEEEVDPKAEAYTRDPAVSGSGGRGQQPRIAPPTQAAAHAE